MKLIVFSFFLFVLGLNSNAQDVATEGRLFGIPYPACQDLDSPVELTKSCRVAAHGLEDTEASSKPAERWTPWIKAGSGKTQSRHCDEYKATIVLQPNERFAYTHGEPFLEEPQKRIDATYYRYLCPLEIKTYNYIDKVSEHCVPAAEQYTLKSDESCLNETQKQLLASIDSNGGYEATSLRAYEKSLGKDANWTELKDNGFSSLAAVVSTTCGDIPNDLTPDENLSVNLQCLKSLVQGPHLDILDATEKEVIQGQAERVRDAIVIEQRIEPSESADVEMLEWIATQ